jgi:DNA repair exonuclease SbcCD nuclease subunit
MTEPKPALLCMGDLHLSHLIWYRHKDIADDALVAFTELVDRAIEMAIPLVLVGDLNDTVTPPTDIVEFIRSQVDRCAAAAVPIYFIDGNHDKRPTPWLTAISDWPIHIGHGELTEINGITVAGFDYALAIDIQTKLATLASLPDRPQVLFLHQAVRQGLGFENAWNCDLDWVPDGIPLVVMGDIHAPTQYRLRDGGTALYTGSTHPRNLGELGTKSMVVVNEDLTWARVPFVQQRSIFFTHLLEGQADELEPFFDWAADAGSNAQLPPVLWLKYTIDRALFVDEVEQLLRTRFSEVILVRDPLKFSPGTKIETGVDTSDMPTLAQLAVRVVKPEEQPVAYALVQALLDPKCNPQEVIAAHRAQFLTTRNDDQGLQASVVPS